MLRRQELFSAAAWPWYSCLAQVSSPNLRQAARNWNITLEEKDGSLVGVMDTQRHFIRYVYHVKRDSLFTDLFAKLGRS